MPRVHYPNAVYHVTARGVEKRDIFLSVEDRSCFLRFLDDAVREAGASLLSFCLMTNHVHLLIAIAETPLEIIMQKALTRYALYFNRIHDRVGHLFQDRYGAKTCEDPGYLIRVTAYIHLNPVRAGLVPSPERWPWSSHAELVEGRHRYLDLGRFEAVTGMTVEELRSSYLALIEEIGCAKESPRPKLAELLKEAAAAVGLQPGSLATRRDASSCAAKRLLLRRAGEEGYSDADVARILGCSRAAISRLKARKVNSVPDPLVNVPA